MFVLQSKKLALIEVEYFSAIYCGNKFQDLTSSRISIASKLDVHIAAMLVIMMGGNRNVQKMDSLKLYDFVPILIEIDQPSHRNSVTHRHKTKLCLLL
jgi:hypothetical protein